MSIFIINFLFIFLFIFIVISKISTGIGLLILSGVIIIDGGSKIIASIVSILSIVSKFDVIMKQPWWCFLD